MVVRAIDWSIFGCFGFIACIAKENPFTTDDPSEPAAHDVGAANGGGAGATQIDLAYDEVAAGAQPADRGAAGDSAGGAEHP